MSTFSVLKLVVASLEGSIVDKELRGRLSVDLADILEACRWYVNAVGGERSEPLSQDELETLLIEIDVNVVQHLSYHLESLGKDLPLILESIGRPEDKEGT